MSTDDGELLAAYPDLPVDHDNKDHYRGWLERRLMVNRCRDCSRWHHPPRSLCPDCWSPAIGALEVSGRGSVYLAVALHQGPAVPEVDYATPHTVVTAELDEQPGLRFSTAFRGRYEDVVAGMPVRLVWVDRRGRPYPVWDPDL